MATPYQWSEEQFGLNSLREEIVSETRGHYIASMDPMDFMRDFLPWNHAAMRIHKLFKAQKPSEERIGHLKEMSTKSEGEMYKCFEDAFSGWPDACGVERHHIELRDTHNCRDSWTGLGPGFSIYGENLVPQKTKWRVDFSNLLSFVTLKETAYMDAFIDLDGQDYDEKKVDSPTDTVKGGEDAEESEHNSGEVPDTYVAEDEEPGKYDPKHPEVKIQFKDDAALVSPNEYPCENNDLAGANTRGQIASYADVAMAMQFRSHLFSVLICGQYARLIRWDRSCAIVTRRFDYTARPLILFEFFHRFAQLTKSQRGQFPIFTTLSKEEGHDALETLQRFADTHFDDEDAARCTIKSTLPSHCSALVCMVYNNERYAVEAPRFDRLVSPFGRQTRNRLIVRLAATADQCQVLCFKDYWREHSGQTKPEAEVYSLIASHSKLKNCSYFARMYAGGDLSVQNDRKVTTIGHKYLGQEWVSGGDKWMMRKLTAHFVILETIGQDLKTFRSAHDLVGCMADAMEGEHTTHQLAYDELHILHRDISASNILMSTTNPRRGILIDWDRCIFMDMLSEGEKGRVHRAGTWEFMSAPLAMNPKTASHSLIDNRESALHVLMYLCIRYLHHNMASHLEMKDLLSIFDDYLEQEGDPLIVGTGRKVDIICAGGPRVKFEIYRMTFLVCLLCERFSARYHVDRENPRITAIFTKFWSSSTPIPSSSNGSLVHDRLAALNQPDWLYSLLRDFSKELPEPEGGQTDFVDNFKLTCFGQQSKRPRDQDSSESVDNGPKRVKRNS